MQEKERELNNTQQGVISKNYLKLITYKPLHIALLGCLDQHIKSIKSKQTALETS